MKFAGYTKVYEVAETDDAKAEAAENADALLPPVEVGDVITLESVRPEQHFTQPPPRFSEASLVKELEEKGIGRPSTYAAIMSTIVDRGYVEKKEARFWPTELGILVNGLLVGELPRDRRRRLHREDGVRARQGRGGHERLAQAARRRSTRRSRSSSRRRAIEMRDVKREEIADRVGVREVRQADGDQVGAQRQLPRVPGLPGVPQHQGGREEPRRHVGEGPGRRPPTRSARPAARR